MATCSTARWRDCSPIRVEIGALLLREIETTEAERLSRATIRWISGPVLRALAEGSFALREAVHVGPQALLGEVVRIDHDEIVVQVYEDTTGLRPGVSVAGSGLPLAIPLGPGLLGNIFDGLLRPLSGTDSAFVQPGMRRAAAATFAFAARVRAGETIDAGGSARRGARRVGPRAERARRRPMSAAS